MSAEETTPLLKQNGVHVESTVTQYSAADTSTNNPVSSNEPAAATDALAESAEAPQVSARHLASIVIPMSIGIFLAAMDGTIIVSSYASIGSELKQLQSTSWLATGYMLTLTSFQPLYGKLSDIFGRKGCLITAYSIFTLGCLFCSIARTMPQLIASRALAGIGGAGMTTVVSIVMSDVVPLRQRGTWQGIINIVFATGSATGAPLGGLLADSVGWRWAFLFQVPVALIAIATVSFSLRLPKIDSSKGEFAKKIKRVDFVGAITLVVSIFSLLLGMDRASNVKWSDPLTVGSISMFIVVGALFILNEFKFAREPFAPKRIIGNGSLLASYLCNFFGIAGAMATLYYISLYLQAVLGKSAHEAGLWLIPPVIGGVVGSLGGGLSIQSTSKYYWITFAGYVLHFGGNLSIALSSGVLARTMVGIMMGLVISSIGNGSGITTTLISLIAIAGPEDQAIATAVSYLFRSLGSVVGLAAGSTLLQVTLRDQLRKHLSGQGVDVDELVRKVRESLDFVKTLDPATQNIVTESYESAVQSVLLFTVIMTACSLLSSIFIKEVALRGK